MKNTTAKTLTLTAKKAPRKAAELAVPKTATSYFLETESEAKVTVVKTRSRLASVKAAEIQDADVAANEAVVVKKRIAKVELAAEDKPVKARAKKLDAEPNIIETAGQSVSQTTDAAALAAIDTSGYLLPSVKVPGRRGRKPSEFTPENDEVAALNAVERAELKAVSKAKERKAKAGLSSVLAADEKTSEADLERRRNQIKNLINLGKERGFLTYTQINDQLPENIIDPEAIEGIIATFNDMGIAVYERA
ncbi:MAG: RNA polymerase sigma factor region1.1 domain-containing protein, partial [Pseudomonadota bacterium]